MKKVIAIMAALAIFTACKKKTNTVVSQPQAQTVIMHNYVLGMTAEGGVTPTNDAIVNVNVNGSTISYTLVAATSTATPVFNKTISLQPGQYFTISVVNGAINVVVNSNIDKPLINSTINVPGWTGVYPASYTQNY